MCRRRDCGQTEAKCRARLATRKLCRGKRLSQKIDATGSEIRKPTAGECLRLTRDYPSDMTAEIWNANGPVCGAPPEAERVRETQDDSIDRWAHVAQRQRRV